MFFNNFAILYILVLRQNLDDVNMCVNIMLIFIDAKLVSWEICVSCITCCYSGITIEVNTCVANIIILCLLASSPLGSVNTFLKIKICVVKSSTEKNTINRVSYMGNGHCNNWESENCACAFIIKQLLLLSA